MTPAERSAVLSWLPPADRAQVQRALLPVRHTWRGCTHMELAAAVAATLELLLLAYGLFPLLEEWRHAA